MLEAVKLALRITTDAFDEELGLLIESCLEEMQGLGVVMTGTEGEPVSPQVRSAVIAYCKWQFGENEQADRWSEIYHVKLAQLKTMTGFTNWEA